MHSFAEHFSLYQTDIAITLVHLGFLFTFSRHSEHSLLTRNLAAGHSKVCSPVRNLNVVHFRLYDLLLRSYSCFIDDLQAEFMGKSVKMPKTGLMVLRKRCVCNQRSD